jgi:hypothetical protein
VEWYEILGSFNQLLKNNGATITALATVILAWLTSRYVKLTNHMLEETRATRGPSVYVDIEFNSHEAKLIIGNSGFGAAQDILFEVQDSIPWAIDDFNKGLANLTPIKHGIPYLAPTRVLKYRIGTINSEEFFSKESKASLKINYTDSFNNKNNIEFEINMNAYDGVLIESFYPPEELIAKQLERNRIQAKSGSSMTSTMNRMFKKSCPICGETISSSAKKCPKCLEFIADEK